MVFQVLRTLRHYPWRLAKWPLVCAALAVLTAQAHRLHALSALLATVATACLLPLTMWWTVRWAAPAVTTRSWVRRRDDASEHAGGVATWLDVVQRSSARAIRGQAGQLRPSLAVPATLLGVRVPRGRLGRFGRPRVPRRVPTTAYAVPLLRTGWLPGRVSGSTVWSSCEENTLRIGGPRTRKTASIACHILDAPGAVLVTSSRTDLLDATAAARADRGRVVVFNPTGLGNLPSTVRWSPLAGCTDLAVAHRRATDLIPAGSSVEGERWDLQARDLLSVLLHAAALSGGTMQTIHEWISPAEDTARRQILLALESAPGTEGLQAQVTHAYTINYRTLTSVTATLAPAIRWANDRTAAQVGDAPLDDPDFLDVAALVAGGCDSLYLIGREGACRPLIGALTAEVAEQVRRRGAVSPGGRLDPPMTAVLDEVPLTCGPIPLHDWTADMGGRGWTLHLAAQSLAQLRDVYGRDRAETILGNTGSLLVFGGLKSADDLDRISTLTGTRLVQLDPDDRRPIPVMTPGEIAALPPGTALLIRTGLRPLVGKPPVVWTRRDAHRALPDLREAAGHAIERPEPAGPVGPPRLTIVPPLPGQRDGSELPLVDDAGSEGDEDAS